MAFHEVRFPADVSFGATGGPERRTEIVTLANGYEERNSPWAHSRRRYDAGLGLRSMRDVETVLAFFEARRGQLHGFRWKDWSDYRSAPSGADIEGNDQVIGVADGETATFHLCKTYGLGDSAYIRPISKPVFGTVKIEVQGAPLEEADFTLDPVTGRVQLAEVPVRDAIVTAGFEFDVPVRFDTDRIAISLATFNAGQVPDVPVVEVRL